MPCCRAVRAIPRVHPRIQLVLTIDNRVLDLGRREADVALRVRRPTDPALFGRRLTGIAWAFYGAGGRRPNLRREGGTFNFARHSVIGWDEPSRIVVGDWIAANVPAGSHRLSQQQPGEPAHGRARAGRHRAAALLSRR